MNNQLPPDIQAFGRVTAAAIGMVIQPDHEMRRIDLVAENGDVACSTFWGSVSVPREQDAALYALESALTQLLAKRDKLQAENATLRQILCASAKAVDASVSPECSIEFMALLPAEIHLVVARLRKEPTAIAAPGNDRLEAGLLALANYIGPTCTNIVRAAIGKEVSNDQPR